MASPYVLAFVGENANGILRWWTEEILAGFARHGFGSRLIDLQGREWQRDLADTLGAGRPAFCFSFQGFGMDHRVGGQNFWSRNGIPFLTYLGDNPHHFPPLHAAEGAGLYLLYSCKDFLDTYRDILGGKTFARIIRYGYPENPMAERIAWRDRPVDVVFVKTAVDPARLEREWESLPAVTRTILYESAEEALAGSDRTVAAICAAAFERNLIHVGDRRELLLHACCAIDRYVRAVRAERMVRALLRHDVLIVGDWSHLDTSGARARFAPPLPAEDLDALYAEAKLVVNTSPSVRYGIHERIMGGLLAKSAVLSDITPFLRQTLAPCPAFLPVDIDAADFPCRLDAALSAALADPAMPDKTAVSLGEAKRMFSMDAFVAALLEHVQLERHRRTVLGWCFPPNPAAMAA